MRKAIFVGIAVSIALVTIIGCSKDPVSGSNSPLVGTWVMTQVVVTPTGSSAGTTITASATAFDTIVLNSNNTYSQDHLMQGASGTMSGTWSSAGDSLIMPVPAPLEDLSLRCSYVLSGTTLTLTYKQTVLGTEKTYVETFAKH
ncbi:MAG: hypothetical protein PHC61_01455 [Chitinivibrionales bacterium]|nr:hypothetical protein [Chitinivibrionales bacterium]